MEESVKRRRRQDSQKEKFSLSDMDCENFIQNWNTTNQKKSIAAFAGADYALIAVNVSNDVPKCQGLHRIARRLVMGSTGTQCKTANLASLVRARLYMNEYIRQREMKPRCVALLLSCLLTNDIGDSSDTSYMVAGIDDKGKGVIYAYDLLGYHERTQYRAMGIAKVFLQSYIQSQLYNKTISNDEERIEMTFDEALEMIIKAFQEAAKRKDVYTADKVIISGITSKGVCFEEFQLL